MKHYTIVLNDGFRVGVTEGGSGIPLVFLHGLSVSAEAYTEMLELLAHSGFHVIALDLPDHGRTDSLPWGHDVADMAYVVWRAIGAIPALEGAKFVLAGHSMGGAVAATYASYWPSYVHTLILLDAAVGESHDDAVRLDNYADLPLRAAQFLGAVLRDCVGDARRAGSLRTLRERLSLGRRLKESVSGFGSLKAAWALTQNDSAPALFRIKRQGTRTVVVHGSRDSIIPVEAAYDAWRA